MGQFSSDFSSSAGWTLTGCEFTGGVFVSTSNYCRARYDTPCNGLTQYSKAKFPYTGGNGSGPAVRLSNDDPRYYALESGWGGIWLTLNSAVDGWIADIGFVDIDLTNGDSVAITIDGTGQNCTVRVWHNPTNAVPHDVANWDSANDPPDGTITNVGATWDLQGYYVGVGSQLSQSNTLDDWSGGDVPTGIIMSYRTGATKAACEAANWIEYTAPFESSGFAQVKVEAPE
jgi:hypothetical protein